MSLEGKCSPPSGQKSESNSFISVVICTRDRRDILPETVPAISSSSFVEEIIYVEGVSPVGKSRDIGWRKAKNELICFIDDDEIPSDEWFKRMVNVFHEENIGAAGSIFEPIVVNTLTRMEALVINHSITHAQHHVRMIRRRALDEVGGVKHSTSETVLLAQELAKKNWTTVTVNYPLKHLFSYTWKIWFGKQFGSGKAAGKERIEIYGRTRRLLFSPLRGMDLAITYRNWNLILFYPLRCAVNFFGMLVGYLVSLNGVGPRKTEMQEAKKPCESESIAIISSY